MTDILPALLVFSLGLSLVVAPLTATVLGAASEENAGVASAINTDVARVASLLAVAVIPVAAGHQRRRLPGRPRRSTTGSTRPS